MGRLSTFFKSCKQPKAASSLSASSAPDGDRYHPPPPGLFKLPAELRNDIYTLVFTSEEGILEITKEDIYPRTALLRTCSQIREEAIDIFLTSSHFRLLCGAGKCVPAMKWLRRLDLDRWNVRTFELQVDLALDLRQGLAESRAHALLERFSHRAASLLRRWAYAKAYRAFAADFHALTDWVEERNELHPLLFECVGLELSLCAPANRVRLRVDEYHYTGKIQILLFENGFA